MGEGEGKSGKGWNKRGKVVDGGKSGGEMGAWKRVRKVLSLMTFDIMKLSTGWVEWKKVEGRFGMV